MLSFITGTIKQCTHNTVSLEISTVGLALTIHVPNEALFSINKVYTLYTHLHWHQENGPTLYGFEAEAEKKLFITLIGCSGIGPKRALTMLSHLNVQECVDAIIREDSTALSKIPGIGKRKAEQIIVQLKNSVASLADTENTSPFSRHLHQISEVLTSLNYTRKEISLALQHIKAHTQANDAFDILLRTSLSFLSKAR